MVHYPITEDHVRFYQENGYIRLDNVLTMEEVEVLRKALARAVEDKNKYNLNLGPRTDEGYAKVFLQMVNLWERYPVIEDYIHNVRIAEIARKLTRSSSVRLWHEPGPDQVSERQQGHRLASGHRLLADERSGRAFMLDGAR